MLGLALAFVEMGGDRIVQWIIGRLPMTIKDRKQLQKISIPQAGRLIGYLERLLVILLVLSREFGAIAFVIAAKAIIRFESSKERAFAEYFLVGTFASVLVAASVGVVLLAARIIP